MCAIFFIGFLFFSVWFFAFRKFSGCRGLRAYVFKLPILKAQHRIKKTLLPIFCQQKSHFLCYIQSNQCRLTLLNARLNNLRDVFPPSYRLYRTYKLIGHHHPYLTNLSYIFVCMHDLIIGAAGSVFSHLRKDLKDLWRISSAGIWHYK